MRVISPAGEFEILPSTMEVEGRNLVIKGRMGIWDAKSYITPEELNRMARMAFKPAIFFYFLKLPFLLLAKSISKMALGLSPGRYFGR